MGGGALNGSIQSIELAGKKMVNERFNGRTEST